MVWRTRCQVITTWCRKKQNPQDGLGVGPTIRTSCDELQSLALVSAHNRHAPHDQIILGHDGEVARRQLDAEPGPALYKHAGVVDVDKVGYPVSDMLLIPGALFEITLPFWLFIKGFSATAYGKAA